MWSGMESILPWGTLSCVERGGLDFEELVRIEVHGGEVPGDFEGHETVQAAPDKNGRVVLVPNPAGNS